MTQNETILEHIKKNGSITSLEAFELYRITRLSGRIHDLRAQGNNITTEKVKAKNGAIYAVYKLKGEG